MICVKFLVTKGKLLTASWFDTLPKADESSRIISESKDTWVLSKRVASSR